MIPTVKTYQRFDEGPFIEDRLVCGINALIETLELPLEKLTTVDRLKITGKLLKLAIHESIPYFTLISQCVNLQILIELHCGDDEELIERVFFLCEEKFKYFLKTSQFI